MKKLLPMLFMALISHAAANDLLPPESWMKQISVQQPLIKGRLGMVTLVSDNNEVQVVDFSMALREALRQSNLFSKEPNDRIQVLLAVKKLKYVGQESGMIAEVEYQLKSGDDLVYKTTLETSTANVMTYHDARHRVLAANLKLFLIELRKAVDQGFSAEAEDMTAQVAKDVNRRGVMSYVGEGVARGFLGTASAGIAVAKGVGTVAMTAGEIAANEEFRNSLATTSQHAEARDQQMIAEGRAAIARGQAEGQAEWERRQAAARPAPQPAGATYAEAAAPAAPYSAPAHHANPESPTVSGYQAPSTTTATLTGTQEKPAAQVREVTVKRSQPAQAWCYRIPKSGNFTCDGPTQRMLSSEKSFRYALSLAGCSGAGTHEPEPEPGESRKYYCGRSLESTERVAPETSPLP